MARATSLLASRSVSATCVAACPVDFEGEMQRAKHRLVNVEDGHDPLLRGHDDAKRAVGDDQIMLPEKRH
jgi:hypothetical protein